MNFVPLFFWPILYDYREFESLPEEMASTYLKGKFYWFNIEVCMANINRQISFAETCGTVTE